MASSPRTLVLAALAALVAGALLYVTLHTEPVPVDLHEVARGPMQITINADGQTRVRQVYDVSAPFTGIARRSPVEAGDKVIANETIVAVVEPVALNLLDTRSRLQAEALVSEAEAALHVVEAQVRQSEEDLAYAQGQYDRVAALVERGVASLTRLEGQTQALSAARAAHDAALSRLEMASGSLDRARAALIEPTSGNGGAEATCCLSLLAPITGTVLEVETVSERPVQAGARLVSLGQTDDLEIVADLLSSDAVRLKAGALAYVERWGGPEVLRARMRKVSPAARTRISALGIEEQRVDVDFELISPASQRAGLGDGFAVFLRIVEWQAEDVVQVPLSALFRTGEAWSVFVAEDGVARRVTLEIGRKNGQMAQVLTGIAPGARVVTHPSDEISDGTPITDRRALE